MSVRRAKPTHGGARPGAGRPKGEGWVKTSLAFRPDMLDRVKREAKAAGMSVSGFITDILQRALH